jgi:hypothetical protein
MPKESPRGETGRANSATSSIPDAKWAVWEDNGYVEVNDRAG